MPREHRSYQQPSRSSRILITLLAVSVVLLAGWIVYSNTMMAPRGTTVVALAPEPVPALVQAVRPPMDQTASIVPPTGPGPVGRPAIEEFAQTEAAPLLPEPIVVASAQGVPLPVPAMLPSLASSRTRLIELDTPPPAIMAPEEAQEAALEVVPLPPRRPKIAGIPLPRPRPELEVAVDRTGSQSLSDAEIARMQ